MSASVSYNIVVFGEPGVGKTCFADQFCYGRSFVFYNPGNDDRQHPIFVEERTTDLTLMDLSTSFLKPEQSMHSPEWAETILADADGVVLLYDVTSSQSFDFITNQAYRYLWGCRRFNDGRREGAEGGERDSFGCVLVGNKADLIIEDQASRAVPLNLANDWALTQGIRSIEVDSLARNGPESALRLLVKNIWKLEKLGVKVVEGKK
ncbi:hypothetical protein B5807_07778 [Epicoccum nigrum]|jgi:GTPase SAR1 family protein|uniref:P-loop containing nucleoside triphosphate hydrolase protein n=1 Tax=Epicoccum nigrum TaxID=105696 RepID=A0A1Y2LZ52_EPING|nr:hypothetical protein B5807_07778 [Epicoccum nigrum]